MILSNTEVRQADLVLVNRNRLDILTNRRIEGPPDLVIEVVSPSTLKRDKTDKLQIYAYYRIPEYWIVDPNTGTLEQYVIVNDRSELSNIFQGKIQVTSPNIPCISFTMKEIMDNIPNLKN